MILLCVGTFVYFAPGAVFVTSTLLPHLVLVLGATISLVSFLGYYGVMTEKRWVLWVHGLILLIAIALQITVGAFAFAYRNQGSEVLDRAWERVFRSDPRVILDLESFVSDFCLLHSLFFYVLLLFHVACSLVVSMSILLLFTYLCCLSVFSSNAVDLNMSLTEQFP